jgi:hypothetical protein
MQQLNGSYHKLQMYEDETWCKMGENQKSSNLPKSDEEKKLCP